MQRWYCLKQNKVSGMIIVSSTTYLVPVKVYRNSPLG